MSDSGGSNSGGGRLGRANSGEDWSVVGQVRPLAITRVCVASDCQILSVSQISI